MWVYLLKSGACLAIFFAFYKLFLEKQNMHTFKRFYLLGALLISFGIPFITFVEYIEPLAASTPIMPVIETNTAMVRQPIIEEESNTNFISSVLWLIYIIGLVILSTRFFVNFKNIIFSIKQNTKQHTNGFVYVLLNKRVLPHTFFNYIFLEKEKFKNKAIPNEVLWHEEAHSKQLHTLDILFIEILQIIMWFNPLIYYIKKAIKLNHEFLADYAILNKGVEPSSYKNILLEYTVFKQHSVLSNAFNNSFIKKRFTVMKTKTSKSKKWLLILLFLPLTAALIYGFSNKNIVEKEATHKENAVKKEQDQKDTPVNNQEEEKPQETKKSKKVTIDSYYAGVRLITYKKGLIYKDTIVGQGIISDKLYEDLTDEEKKKNPFLSFVPKPLIKQAPTKEQIEEVLDPKKFAVFIDGKNIPNAEIKKYDLNDIAYYSGRSFIHKTGRKGKFPQPFWAHFYTHEYFDARKMGVQKTHYPGKYWYSYKTTIKMGKKYNQ